MDKPNFFILGAGRSGTTYLWGLLKQHPNIFLTTPKEPIFFCSQFQLIKNPIDYYKLYDAASDETIRGEASHAYLTDPSTPKILKALFPEAQFLVILRNPADRAYSLYHWMRRSGYEYMNTFEKALEAEESRFNSKRFINNCPEYFYNFLYFRSGLYAEQLNRYFAIFPKHQFHIIKFEEFIADPIDNLKKIFFFLEVDQNFSPQFEVPRNTVKRTPRFPGIQYVANTKLKRLCKTRKICLSILQRLNMTHIEPLPKRTREWLLDRYTDDLNHLFDMTGIAFCD